MTSSLLEKNSAKKIASIDIKDAEEAGLSQKIMKDLRNPRSKVAQNVNKAIFEAWGVHLAVDNGKLFMETAKGEDR
ncbi:MAG: hypothetical protein IKS41_02570 [Alphaproteobacteria bacterium]|nr:hypothetical protein [Alphaproteobacteria bacterium]